ncbi:T9SS type A sorting domain-containing protein [Lewinella sp. IMCC34191]|uniref:T9SS type A sorting domain-containing protein n=1 Tax=Lewinella sp. IMCC34191 TaxID=2259172 RepID=UPI000E24F2C7|nr:T9SS type A sorting domain-containing protein [Lewinella sp. IMCC34191]
MQRLLLLFCCFAATLGLQAQTTVLSDFEGDDDLVTWEAVNGTYNGVVENPEDSTGINPSASAGSYTKSGEHAYSQFVGTFAEPLDLSEQNVFSIQVYADTNTSFILKLEGAVPAENIEMKKNIATANVWRTYTFDFSEAAEEFDATRVLIFFDENMETTTNTYLIDNFTVSEGGPCAGTPVDPLVIDDFECQRNATYGIGYDDVEVIVNPEKTGINTSDSVGRYTDQTGAYHALVIAYDQPIDLSANAQFCIKVWAPETGNLLFKLEGYGNTFEVPVQITQTNQWVEACADFSGAAGTDFSQFVLFFNAGVDDAEGDVYYIDDIIRMEAPEPEAIEDFEDDAKLTWVTTGTNNGTFNGVVDNPDMTGANTSENVGSYTRGTAQFAFLQADLPEELDLSTEPQLNLDVWAPDGATTVTLQLVSTLDGAVSVEVPIPATGSWQTLNFNFEANASTTDFSSLRLLFDSGTTGTGTYYFDNLFQGTSTVDNCADVEVDPRILDDFECQRNANYTVGAGDLSVIDNPDGGNNSGNTSSRVGQFDDPAGEYNALAIGFDDPIDLSLNNQLMVDIWAPVAGDILFKLEGGTGADVEIRQPIPETETESWVTYTVDLSAYEGMGYQTLVMFFGAGTDNAAVNTYYVDNIRLNRPPYTTSCIATFESADYTLTNGFYFENGAFTDNGLMSIDNPDMSEGNMSETVGVFEEAADGTQTWAGLALPLDAPVTLVNGAKTATMKVWMEVAGTVVFKLERPRDGAPGSGDIPANYTTAGEWQELTFDLSALPDGATYDQITLLMNSTEIPASNLTHYFDDIAVGGGDCAALTSIFNSVRLDNIRAFPNPVTDELTIDNPNSAVRFTLTNMLGQQVKELVVDGNSPRVQWPVDDLRSATYVLGAYDRSGRIVARSMIVKR